MRLPRPPRPLLAVSALVLTVGVLLPAGGASAHTALDFSLPAEGTTVSEPVSEIAVGFTDVVALVGNGFEVLDPQGNLVVPFAVTDDDKIFRLQLDPPLAGGPVLVTYHVRSLDGHELDGQVSFTAAAEPPAPTTSPPATSPVTDPPPTDPTTTAPATTAATEPPTVASTTGAPDITNDATDDDSDDSDDDSNRALLIGGLAVVVIGSLVFVVLRSRRAA